MKPLELLIFRLMLHRITLIFIALLSFSSTQGQSIDFSTSWDETLRTARAENKLIFIDFYTDWCGPCKMMDKSVFSDSSIAAFYNEHFVNFKANAENKADDNGSGFELAQQYGIKAYPSLFIIDTEGQVITQHKGGQSRFEMLNQGQESLGIKQEIGFVNSFKNTLSSRYSQSTLEKILTLTINHPFDNRLGLVNQYMNLVDTVNDKVLKLIMPQVEAFDIQLLDRISPITTRVSSADLMMRRDRDSWIGWKRDTAAAVRAKIAEATKTKNRDQFEKAISIFRRMSDTRPKDADQLYYEYYRQNDLESYKTFAEYMINEYIIKFSPEIVKRSDESNRKMLESEYVKQLEEVAADRFGITKEVEIEENETQSETLGLDKMIKTYGSGIRMADRLYDISSDYYAFYGDPESLAKAEKWAAKAYEYFPYDLKYYENHMVILYALNENDKIEKLKELVQNLPLYSEMQKLKSKSF